MYSISFYSRMLYISGHILQCSERPLHYPLINGREKFEWKYSINFICIEYRTLRAVLLENKCFYDYLKYSELRFSFSIVIDITHFISIMRANKHNCTQIQLLVLVFMSIISVACIKINDIISFYLQRKMSHGHMLVK